MIPQLRVRTEFSFRQCYGPLPEVAARLAEIGCAAAGIVDNGTWGHVQWEKVLSKAGIQPMFGFEAPVEAGEFKPLAWGLAESLPDFYSFTSSKPRTAEAWAAARGVVRFAGAALDDPEAFDYIDINPMSRRRAVNALRLHKATGKPLVVTSDNVYPARPDLGRFAAICGSSRTTPSWILSDEELRAAIPVDDATWAAAVRGNHEVAERLAGVKLRAAPIIRVAGDLHALVEEGRQYRMRSGHIKAWTDEYQSRLERELLLIEQKAFSSYFLVVADLVLWAKQRMLVGPGRGSSAGSLACYLLRITEVDPLVHGLLFERFIDANRSDLPDIDIDFNDQKRALCFEHLAEKYGSENIARIGSINTLKPRSVMAEVSKRMGIPRGRTFNVLNVLIEYSGGDARYGKGLEDTLENTQPGRDFMRDFPEAAVMGDVENHAWHTGVHAAGIIVSNEPVIEYCTVIDGVAQIDKQGAEYLGLLKIDALGLRTLGVIEDSGCITPEELYGLALDDPEVLAVFNAQKFSGIFQFEGAVQRRVSAIIPIKSFKQIDHITALARPGPLGSGAATTYAARHAGSESVGDMHPLVEPYVKETHGLMLYQEQLMFIGKNLGELSWDELAVMRKAMSGSKGEEFFDQMRGSFLKGATKNGMDLADATKLWKAMVTFGAWGMNKSHTVSYSTISYWCAHMKRYHPLEYAASCLRSAKDDEQVVEILRELVAEGVRFIPFDADLSEGNWAARDNKLVGGFQNLVGIGPAKARLYMQRRANGGLTAADRERLAALPVKNSELRPAHARWGEWYSRPAAFNIAGRLCEFADLKDGDNAVVIGRLVKKERRDENEQRRLEKRSGERTPLGLDLFLDLFMVDDSVSKPARVRVGVRDWLRWGAKIADRAVDNDDWFLVRGRWMEQFQILLVKKIRCLTNPELLS